MKAHKRNGVKIILLFILLFLCMIQSAKVLAALPPEAEIHNQMGNDFCNKGEFDKAVEEYKKAVEIYPQFVDALYNLGVTYFNDLKDYEQAARYFTEFLQLENKSQDAKQVKSILEIIEKEHNIVYKLPQEKEAKSPKEKDKKDKEVKNNKAVKEDEVILQAFEFKNKGNRYTKEGEYELAIAQYKKALEIYPDYLDVLYNIAKVYYFELGNKEEAVKYWEKFLEHEPADSPDAKLVTTWINEAKLSIHEGLGEKDEDEGIHRDEPEEQMVSNRKEEKQEDTELDERMKEKARELQLAGVRYEKRPYSKGPITQIPLNEQKSPIEPSELKKEEKKIEKEILFDKGLKEKEKNIPKQEIILTTYLPKEKRTRDIYAMVRDEIEKELILIFTQKKARDPRKLADIFKTKMQRDILPNGDEISVLTLPSHLLTNIERVYILTPEERRELEKEKWELIRSRQSPERLKELLNFIREGYIIK
ncbi:MAG: tetratricopeptide repeat protein [bacterium]